MLRLTLRKEPLERWCRLIFTALCFHWDDLRAVLDQEIDLTFVDRLSMTHFSGFTKFYFTHFSDFFCL